MKIPDLPLASALDGTETSVVVQGGVTKQGSIGALVNAQVAPQFAAINAQLAQLLYSGPTIKTFTATPAMVEIGATASSVALAWSLAGAAPTAMTVDGSGLSASATSETVGPYSADHTFTLKVTDGAAPAGVTTGTASATASVLFRPKAYFGLATSTAPSDSDLRAMSSDWGTARARSVTYAAAAGGYPCYAWPASLGAIGGVSVGGLAYTDFTVTTRNVVNASGATVSMNILVFNGIQHGAAIGVAFS